MTDTGVAIIDPIIRFDPSQQRFFRDESRVIVVNWHRQKGKDFTAAAKAVDHALRTGQDWYIVSLTQRQADATFAKCKRVAQTFMRLLKIKARAVEGEYGSEQFDPWINQAFQFTAREIRFPNGARVVSLPGRDPDTLAGLSGNVIFTEFGLFPGGGYAHWAVVFPIATRGFSVIVISTPRGKNTKFYELFSDPQTYSVHFCDIYKSVAEDGFVLKDNNGNPTTIEHFRRLYNDEGKWPREYECKFTGDLQALISWAMIEAAAARGEREPFDFLQVTADAGWDEGFFRRDATPGRLEIGWDVARTGHLSSAWANLGRAGQPKRLRYLVLMSATSFELQRRVIRAAMDARGFNSGVGCGDATGLGMDSNEALATRYPETWEPVNFSSRKSDLGNTGFAAYRDGSQLIPSLEGPHKFIATDVYAVQKVSGDTSDDGEQRGQPKGVKLRLDETENPLLPASHCDIAYSNFLSLRAGARPFTAPMRSTPHKPRGW